MEDLVVVPTNNGKGFLERLLPGLGDHNNILIVDTGSTDQESLDYTRSLGDRYLYHELHYGYSTGALLYAYYNIQAENYLLLQDSLEVLDPAYLEHFKSRLPGHGAVAWTTFGFGWDTDLQCEWAKFQYGVDFPETGIFGPIFYTSRASLDVLAIHKQLPAPAMCKGQAQGTERLWAMAFHFHGLPVTSICGNWDSGAMEAGAYPVFRKVFARRQ